MLLNLHHGSHLQKMLFWGETSPLTFMSAVWGVPASVIEIPTGFRACPKNEFGQLHFVSQVVVCEKVFHGSNETVHAKGSSKINRIHLKNSVGCLAKIKHEIEDEVGINDENNPKPSLN